MEKDWSSDVRNILFLISFFSKLPLNTKNKEWFYSGGRKDSLLANSILVSDIKFLCKRSDLLMRSGSKVVLVKLNIWSCFVIKLYSLWKTLNKWGEKAEISIISFAISAAFRFVAPNSRF